MCIVCYTNIKELLPLEEIHCRHCIVIQQIPQDLINLEILYFFNCPMLLNLSSYFSFNLQELYYENCNTITEITNLYNLEILTCIDCSNLKKITDVFNLKSLVCQNCPLLSELCDVKLIRFKCISTPWLYHPDNNFITNYKKLKLIQLWIKRNLKHFIFKRWIKSKEGIQWIYHPNNIGGRMSKKLIDTYIKVITPIGTYRTLEKGIQQT